jgi:hypothetical protein
MKGGDLPWTCENAKVLGFRIQFFALPESQSDKLKTRSWPRLQLRERTIQGCIVMFDDTPITLDLAGENYFRSEYG